MVEQGFRDAGMNTSLSMTSGRGGRDRHNNIIPDPKKFPNGIKALADYVHSKGLKLGIYSDAAPLAKDVRHGQWPDMDMLVVGLNGKGGPSSDLGGVGCNYTEYQTQMSMWCMMSSVLALSNDLRQLSPEDKRILLNKEMIAIDQDPLGKAAERKVNEKDYQIFVRPLADGSHAVAILNSSDKPIQVLADFKQLGLNGKYLVRDVWQHRDIARKANRWKGKVTAHETKVFVLK